MNKVLQVAIVVCLPLIDSWFDSTKERIFKMERIVLRFAFLFGLIKTVITSLEV